MGEENLGEAKRIFFDSTKSIKTTLQTYSKWYHLNDGNPDKQTSHKFLQVINVIFQKKNSSFYSPFRIKNISSNQHPKQTNKKKNI
jgi:hypothetical protein